MRPVEEVKGAPTVAERAWGAPHDPRSGPALFEIFGWIVFSSCSIGTFVSHWR